MASHAAPAPLPNLADAPAPAATAWAVLAAWPITAVFMLGNIASPLYVVWQAQFGFSKGTLTAIFCWYMVGLAASLLVSGVVSDRLGRKAVLLPALGLAVVAAVVLATADGVLALSIGRVLTGLATGALVSAGTAAVTDLAGTDHRRPPRSSGRSASPSAQGSARSGAACSQRPCPGRRRRSSGSRSSCCSSRSRWSPGCP